MKRPTEVCLLLFLAGALCSDPVQRSSSTTETHELSEIDGHPVEEDKTTTRTTDGHGMMSETTEWSTRAVPQKDIARDHKMVHSSQQTHAQVEGPPEMEVPPEMNNIMSVLQHFMDPARTDTLAGGLAAEGEPTKQDGKCVDVPFVDHDGNSCGEWNSTKCGSAAGAVQYKVLHLSVHHDKGRTMHLTARQACCVCGGGTTT